MDNSVPTLKLKEKISYGFGDLASVLYWQTFMLYFTYFYTDVFLIPVAIAGFMFFISRTTDAVFDPVMGMIADRTKTRWGKFRPYMLWMSIPFAIVGVLTFTVPDLGMDGKIIWAYVTFIAIMFLYTAINIPYTSLLGVISPNSIERTSVSSIKFVFAFSAGIIISATLLPMSKLLGKGDNSIVSASLKDSVLVINEVKKGNATIILKAKDSKGNTQMQEFDFKVNPTENNTPKLVKPIGDINLVAGFKNHEILIEGVFSGNSGQAYNYDAKSTNDKVVKVSIEQNKLKIVEQNIGNAEIQLTAKDEKWGDNTASFFVNVNKQGNNSPVLQDSTYNINLTSGYKSQSLKLNEIIKDPDNDPLTYTVESSNSKVITPNINGNNLSFSEGKPGITVLKIIAQDGKGGHYIHSIQFLISAKTNNPPFINKKISNISEIEGFKTYSLNLSNLFTDTDGEKLQYEVQVVNTAKGWHRSFIIIGIAFVLFFFIAFKGTRERVTPPKSQKSNVGKDLKDLFTNRPWLILLATTITFILFVAIRSSVTVHYFKYVISSQELTLPFLGTGTYDFIALTSAYNTIGQVSSLIGALLVSMIAKKLGKKRTFLVFFIIAIFSTGILYFLTANQLGLIFFFQITGSFTGGPLSVLLWAMYADTADYAEWKNGRRATGLVFSASTMSQKIGWAVGASIALFLMSQVGFRPNEVQTAESIKGLLLLFSLIPAGMGIIALFISLVYPLNDKKVAEIELELMERRKLEQQEA
jgi:Na+/melibiose symporter-like transporter